MRNDNSQKLILVWVVSCFFLTAIVVTLKLLITTSFNQKTPADPSSNEPLSNYQISNGNCPTNETCWLIKQQDKILGCKCMPNNFFEHGWHWNTQVEEEYHSFDSDVGSCHDIKNKNTKPWKFTGKPCAIGEPDENGECLDDVSPLIHAYVYPEEDDFAAGSPGEN